jgi:hypothetical protein
MIRRLILEETKITTAEYTSCYNLALYVCKESERESTTQLRVNNF